MPIDWTVTIRKRHTWAPHVQMDPAVLGASGQSNKWFQDLAARPPYVSNGPWEPWTGGVFIHYIGSLAGFRPSSESQCRAKVAQIYADHFADNGDIQYNFLVCPHGVIYEGRGYERGEANGGAMIDVDRARRLGRNTAFYSIQGMIGGRDEPTGDMLWSMKQLIYHLRYDPLPASRKAGRLIYPHSAGNWPTQCPGTTLRNYAQVGGVLDPAPPSPDDPPASVASLTIVSRAQWGARPPRAVEKVAASQRSGFAVHYSAGPPTQTVRQIQNYHMDSRGWSDIGYNFLVDRGGRIYEGRGWHNLGAHIAGHNTANIGVCFIGRDGDATAQAKVAIRSLYEKTNRVVGRTLTPTYHSALGSTACPGNDLRAWVRAGMPVDGLKEVDGGGGGGGGDGTVRSVAAQQRAVNSLGYSPPLDVDGVFGPLTEAGVKWLQRKVGTAVDGIWGPNTEAAYRAYTGTGDSGRGLTSIRTVASQQRAVNGLGHSPALDVDGVFGPKTEAGVKWLQSRVGTPADGLWGPATERAYNDYTGGGGYSDGGLTTIRSVTYQQAAVNRLGYTPALVVDGVFGPKTDAGVRWLQAKVGTAVDGLWGPDTDTAYSRYSDGARLAVDGVFGPDTVAATQQAIGVTADGSWGPESKRALQRHLNRWADAGLVVDGDVGPATVRALQRHLNSMTGAGLDVDGDWGPGTTRALQTALNQGKF